MNSAMVSHAVDSLVGFIDGIQNVKTGFAPKISFCRRNYIAASFCCNFLRSQLKSNAREMFYALQVSGIPSNNSKRSPFCKPFRKPLRLTCQTCLINRRLVLPEKSVSNFEKLVTKEENHEKKDHYHKRGIHWVFSGCSR